MVMIMVMIKTNLADAKARLSEYVDRVLGGEQVVICRHNQPVAELRALDATRAKPRPIGPLPGQPTFEVPPSFFEPLPADELNQWEGGGVSEWPPPDQQHDRFTRVAEDREPFSGKPKRRSKKRRP